MSSSEEKTKITVDIYGNQYKLMSSNSSNYMKRVAQYVNEQMLGIARGYPRLDSQRIAVLAAVNMADECFRLVEEMEELRKMEKLSEQAQVESDKLLTDYNELKRQYEANLELIHEHTAKYELVHLDMMELNKQNEVLQEQLSAAHNMALKERETAFFVQERFNQLQEKTLEEKEELDRLALIDKEELIRQHFAEKKAILEQHRKEKEQLAHQYAVEKEEQMAAHCTEKNELIQNQHQDEELQVALTKVQKEYSELRDEYAKLQNEYNEWIELVETDGPTR